MTTPISYLFDFDDIDYKEDYARYKLNFGKYKGRSLKEIYDMDNGKKYLGWVLHNDVIYNQIKYKVRHYLKSKTININTNE